MGEMIRLLVVGATWPPETFLARLFRGLMEAGVEVTLACSSRPQPDWLIQPRFRWLPTPAWSEPLSLRFRHLAAQTSRAFIRDPAHTLHHLRRCLQARGRIGLADWFWFAPFVGRRWDVLYFPWNSAAITYLPLFDWGIPVVVSCRGAQVNVAPHNPERLSIRQGLSSTFQRASVVHCVSDAIVTEALAFGLDPAKVKVIRPAVEADFFVPPSEGRLSSPTFQVVTTGSLIWRKGYEYALQAIRLLVDRNLPVQFSIIGDGPEIQRLRYTIHDLRLQDHVRLLGRLSPTQVQHHLHHTDAFLLTSLSEGISNAVLEAMSCGLPIVTTDCGGMREAVTDGVEGFVVPMRNPISIANALVQLEQNPELRRQMGVTGRQRVLKDFSLADQVTQFVKLFENLSNR